MIQVIAILVTLLGLAIEVAGIMLMARPYVKVPIRQLPAALISALHKGEDAKAMVEIAEMAGSRPLDFVQGLAFASLGIALQFLGVLIEFAMKALTARGHLP